MAAFRFVHAADLHLDSPLRSLALRDPELAALIGAATRRALTKIVDLCLHEKVDALLLAGDLYDGEQTSMKTALFLAAQLHRLSEAGVKTFVIRGNHDAASRITRELVFPEGVKLFGGRGERVEIFRGPGVAPVAIHGVSFNQPQAPESLLSKFKPPLSGAINIGMLHTSLGGAAGHDPYAPCSVAQLQDTGFRYWALGHIHKRMTIEGPTTIVMPGNPQGRDINESGPRSVTLTTIAEDGAVTLEERIVAVAQFERVAVDLTGVADWRAASEKLGAALAQARAGTSIDHIVLRPKIFGATPLAWKIRRDLDLLTAEARARAAMAPGCWIESLEADCHAPKAATGSDPREELRRLIEQEVLPSPAFAEDFARAFEALRAKFPKFARDALGADEQTAAALRENLAQQGAQDVLARFYAGASGGQNDQSGQNDREPG